MLGDGMETANCIDSVIVWRDGVIFELNIQECQFGYREDFLKIAKILFSSSVFKLTSVRKKQSKNQSNLYKQRMVVILVFLQREVFQDYDCELNGQVRKRFTTNIVGKRENTRGGGRTSGYERVIQLVEP
jgi:UDP-N-acetylenolpyruvoylglucosamine reductase